MTALIGVRCDGCGRNAAQTTKTQANITRVRDSLREYGWRKTRGTYVAVNGETYGYARDVCPDCWLKGVR